MGHCMTLLTFPLTHVAQHTDEMFLSELQGHHSVYLGMFTKKIPEE